MPSTLTTRRPPAGRQIPLLVNDQPYSPHLQSAVLRTLSSALMQGHERLLRLDRQAPGTVSRNATIPILDAILQGREKIASLRVSPRSMRARAELLDDLGVLAVQSQGMTSAEDRADLMVGITNAVRSVFALDGRLPRTARTCRDG